MIDLVMWLTESKPKSVYAIGSKKITRGTNFKKNSLVILIFEFPNDILVKITANGIATHNHFHELKVFSKDKTLVNSNLGPYIYENDKIVKINSKYPDKKNRKKLIHNFIDTLKNRKTRKIISHKEQIDLMSVCLYAEKSMKTNKKVKIKYIR
tara:strand:- start:114 stop:572 length:459 start_codon:yes stop_codon:yes gene_type:complete